MFETVTREYNSFPVNDKYSSVYDVESWYYADTDLTLFYQVMIRDMYSLWSPKNIRDRIKFAKQLFLKIDIYEVVSETTYVGIATPLCVHFAVFTMKGSQLSFFWSKFTSNF